MGKVYDYPFSDQNGTRTLPYGAAHTYMADIREYPHPRAVSLLQFRNTLVQSGPSEVSWYPNWQELVHTKECVFPEELASYFIEDTLTT